MPAEGLDRRLRSESANLVRAMSCGRSKAAKAELLGNIDLPLAETDISCLPKSPYNSRLNRSHEIPSNGEHRHRILGERGARPESPWGRENGMGLLTRNSSIR